MSVDDVGVRSFASLDFSFEPESFRSEDAISLAGHRQIPIQKKDDPLRASISAPIYEPPPTSKLDHITDFIRGKLDQITKEVNGKYAKEIENLVDVPADSGDAVQNKPKAKPSAVYKELIDGQLDPAKGIFDSSASRLIPVPKRFRPTPKSYTQTTPLQPKTLYGNVKVNLFDFGYQDENTSFHTSALKGHFGAVANTEPQPRNVEVSDRTVEFRKRLRQAKEKEAGNGRFRCVFPQDPTWTVGVVARLSENCLKSIQRNFQEMPYLLAALPLDIQQRFLPNLPKAEEVNLYLAADYFHNETYWRTSCQQKWGRNTEPHTHGSWKLTYIEKLFQERLTTYIPLQTDPNILLNDLLNIGEYVLQLKVNQLLPPVRYMFGDFAAMIEAQLTNRLKQLPSGEEESNETAESEDTPTATNEDAKNMISTATEFPGVKSNWTEKAKYRFQKLAGRELDLNKGIDAADRLLMDVTRELDDTPFKFKSNSNNPFLAADHINLVPVFANMPHLMDLELRYGVHSCGMNFSWRLLQFTLNDARRLAEALIICPSLRRLCLYNSRINDDQGKIICEALIDHPNLAILDLTRNELGDQTAAVVAKMIKRSELLNKVDMTENRVGPEGAKAIAASLVRGVSMRVLNLGHNCIENEGAEALLLVLKSCVTFLEAIDFSANGLTNDVADMVIECMKYNKQLSKYDLSVNEFDGEVIYGKFRSTLAVCSHIIRFAFDENQQQSENLFDDTLTLNHSAHSKKVLENVEETLYFTTG